MVSTSCEPTEKVIFSIMAYPSDSTHSPNLSSSTRSRRSGSVHLDHEIHGAKEIRRLWYHNVDRAAKVAEFYTRILYTHVARPATSSRLQGLSRLQGCRTASSDIEFHFQRPRGAPALACSVRSDTVLVLVPEGDYGSTD